jgi:transcription elongation GreA/GreB family factor
VELTVKGIRVQGVTLASPFGQAFKGARAGETRTFRDRTVEILEIL